MAHTLIRNPGLEPFTLPWPISGTLMPGESRTVPAAVGDVIDMLGDDMSAYLSAADAPAAVNGITLPGFGDLGEVDSALMMGDNEIREPGAIVAQDLVTSAVKVLTLEGRPVNSSGVQVAGANGVGVQVDLATTNAATTRRAAARLLATLTDVTDTTEDGQLLVQVPVNGVQTTRVGVNSTGIGFFGATPAAQAATFGALGAFTDPPSAVEMDALRTFVNAIRTELINRGFVAAA